MTGLRDDFSGPRLHTAHWIDHYLPHWTTPDRSAARYDLGRDGLRLRIDRDQPAWRPEDGAMRVSGIQTGSFAGPVGSARGQHRHRPDGLVVRTAVPSRRLWTPSLGRVEVTASACADPASMLGIWLVGVEDSSPRESGEICIAELFGDRIGPDGSIVRLGVKAHHDPRLSTRVRDVPLPIDATRRHRYGAQWDGSGIRFTVDGREVAASDQVVSYPLQLMIDLFEFPASGARAPSRYPMTATIHSVVAEG